MTTAVPGLSNKPTPWERRQEFGRREQERWVGVVETVIPCRDGLELAADVHLSGDESPAPAIVTITPYGKRGYDPLRHAAVFRGRGYTFVAVDARGRYKSQGEWRAWFGDGDDGFDIVAWVGAQPWCNGRVGMVGSSYGAWVAWATAKARPPELRCLAAIATTVGWCPYTGGLMQSAGPVWLAGVRHRFMLSPDTSVDWDDVLRTIPVTEIGSRLHVDGPTWRDLVMPPHRDGFRDELEVTPEDYAAIDMPCLHVGGWFDFEDGPQTLLRYDAMRDHSPAADHQQLVVGPWAHLATASPSSEYDGVEFGADSAIEIDDVIGAFFDRWLQDARFAEDELTSGTLLFERGTKTWLRHAAWPVADSTLNLYLTQEQGRIGGLRQEPTVEAALQVTYRSDPADPVPSFRSDQDPADLQPPLYQSFIEDHEDVLTFTGEPLAEDVFVSGWPVLKLVASTDGDDTAWHVRLTDVDPAGRSMRVASGCLRAACRVAVGSPAPVPPGEVLTYEIRLDPTHYVFTAGHRIRLQVTSSDYPFYLLNPNRYGEPTDALEPRAALNTVYGTPDHLSELTLPVSTAGPAAP